MTRRETWEDGELSTRTKGLPMCKWVDMETSAVELLFESDMSFNDNGVRIMTACVEVTTQYTNRLSWSESHLLAESGGCQTGRFMNTSLIMQELRLFAPSGFQYKRFSSDWRIRD